MASTEEERKNLAAWSESARYWERHAAAIRAMFAPLSDALIADAALQAGQSTLDVAGGTGEPAVRIAEICGPSSSVTCTDIAFAMVLAARREAASRNLRNVLFAQCAADALPFASDRYDAAVCRLGAMFFGDPIASIREMLRVLKPNGRLAFAVWHESKHNPFFSAAGEVVSRYAPPSPTAPDARGPFRYAAPGKLAGLLARAGATAVSERVFDFRIEAPVALAEFWPLRVEMSETLRAVARRLPSETIATIRAEVELAIRPFFCGDRISFPARALIVSAAKAGVAPRRASAVRTR